MKKIMLSLLVLFVTFISVPSFAETAEQENANLYLIHFGRGDSGRAVSLVDFQAFIKKELVPIMPSGLTFIETEGQRYDAGNRLIREITTVVEIVDSREDTEERIHAMLQKYVNTFRSKGAAGFVVKIPNVSSKLFY